MGETTVGVGSVSFSGEGCLAGKFDVVVPSAYLEESVVEEAVDTSGDDFSEGFPLSSANIEASADCEALGVAAGGLVVDLE